jgi:hypothetical protein
MGSRAKDAARWSARVFGVGDSDGADIARRIPPRLPTGRGINRLDHKPARFDAARAGPQNAQPSFGDLGSTAIAAERSQRRCPARHLLVDSTGLKLCGAGEWLVEKHGTKGRRAWRKLHLGVDADTGQTVASALTQNAPQAHLHGIM